MRLGAHARDGGTTFGVYTTTAKRVAVRVDGHEIDLERREGPWLEKTVAGVEAGALYEILLDGEVVPDPFARSLPRGVHGPARVVAPAREGAIGLSPGAAIYELHVGTFSPEGTYRGAIAKLDALSDLGVSAIEIMPVASFDGRRGWGYDGVALFAPFAPYGEPDELRALVREAHARGIAVVLDVVYNHFGPSGNYLWRYSPSFFDEKIQTPWGAAPDFTNPAMRQLVVENARYWLEEFGFDGLRLDATHEIRDASPTHVLREITDIAHAMSPPRRVFFENDQNDPTIFRELGADAVWADDFHHHVHVLLTQERDGYYAAYEPTAAALAACIEGGWSYTGQPYTPWKGKPRGRPFDTTRDRLVLCVQNHDQVGNRAYGSRLSSDVDAPALESAAVLLLFLPSTALLFMGQEWAATSPFLYFSDHAGELGEAVSKGRRREFEAFASFGGEIPDPQAEETFLRSKLDWSERTRPGHERVLATHRAMLRLRRDDEILARTTDVAAHADGDVLHVARGGGKRVLLLNFGEREARITTKGDVLLATGEGGPPGVLRPRAAVVLAT
jgi:maltooligosyltrehalose trehalohydrolase